MKKKSETPPVFCCISYFFKVLFFSFIKFIKYVVKKVIKGFFCVQNSLDYFALRSTTFSLFWLWFVFTICYWKMWFSLRFVLFNLMKLWIFLLYFIFSVRVREEDKELFPSAIRWSFCYSRSSAHSFVKEQFALNQINYNNKKRYLHENNGTLVL